MVAIGKTKFISSYRRKFNLGQNCKRFGHSLSFVAHNETIIGTKRNKVAEYVYGTSDSWDKMVWHSDRLQALILCNIELSLYKRTLIEFGYRKLCGSNIYIYIYNDVGMGIAIVAIEKLQS